MDGHNSQSPPSALKSALENRLELLTKLLLGTEFGAPREFAGLHVSERDIATPHQFKEKRSCIISKLNRQFFYSILDNFVVIPHYPQTPI
ncbi:hypothetical protein D3C84_1018630 [compost metagenome]